MVLCAYLGCMKLKKRNVDCTAFGQIKIKAREKRDKLIEQAKAEYVATLTAIAKLEQDILGTHSSRHQKLSACVEQVIPREGTFTTVEVMAGLEGLDPGRVWLAHSVNTYITRLRDKGIIRRVRQAKMGSPAVYAWGDAKVEAQPFDNMTLEDVMLQTLVEPKTAVELTLAIVEAGYQTSMARYALRNAVERKLKESGKFRREGKKWVVG